MHSHHSFKYMNRINNKRKLYNEVKLIDSSEKNLVEQIDVRLENQKKQKEKAEFFFLTIPNRDNNDDEIVSRLRQRQRVLFFHFFCLRM